jgi:hypothetical protein
VRVFRSGDHKEKAEDFEQELTEETEEDDRDCPRGATRSSDLFSAFAFSSSVFSVVSCSMHFFLLIAAGIVLLHCKDR